MSKGVHKVVYMIYGCIREKIVEVLIKQEMC